MKNFCPVCENSFYRRGICQWCLTDNTPKEKIKARKETTFRPKLYNKNNKSYCYGKKLMEKLNENRY